FEAARESGAPSSYVDHQQAVFELHHPGGNLERALEAIERAEGALERPDRAVSHTKAAILRQLAIAAPQKLTRENLRERARSILERQTRNSRVPHPYHLTAQLLVDELKDKLAPSSDAGFAVSHELQQRTIAELIRKAEAMI